MLGISCLTQHPSDLCLFRFTLYLPHLKLGQPYHFDSASWLFQLCVGTLFISVFKLLVFVFFGLIIPEFSILVIFIAILTWKRQGVERFQNLHFSRPDLSHSHIFCHWQMYSCCLLQLATLRRKPVRSFLLVSYWKRRLLMSNKCLRLWSDKFP